MDGELRTNLIKGALYLQSHEHFQEKAQHYSSRILSQEDPSRSDPKFTRVVKRFLDSMTLLLVPDHGAKFVTACSLDQPRVDEPANRSALTHPVKVDTAPTIDAISGEGYQNQDPPNFTLRIARNGQFSNSKNEKLSQLAAKIINLRPTGDQAISDILHDCRGKIQHCIVGSEPLNPRIRRFLSLVTKLAKRDAPSYIEALEGRVYGSKGEKYTQQSAGKAYTQLVGSLDHFAQETNAEKGGEWGNALRITGTAAAIRRDKVYMALLSKCPQEAPEVKRFLERLGAYSVALDTLKDACWNPSSRKPLFTNKIAISVLRHRHGKFRTSETKKEKLMEHCEILLARFYLENQDTAPVMDYLSVSKLSCLLCAGFLNCLRDKGVANFRVRGEHGKVYGRWLPPDNIQTREEVRSQVLKGLEDLAKDIQARVQRCKEGEGRKLEACGDSPGWSSDESSGYPEDPSDKNPDRLEYSSDKISRWIGDAFDESGGSVEDPSHRHSDSFPVNWDLLVNPTDEGSNRMRHSSNGNSEYSSDHNSEDLFDDSSEDSISCWQEGEEAVGVRYDSGP